MFNEALNEAERGAPRQGNRGLGRSSSQVGGVGSGGALSQKLRVGGGKAEGSVVGVEVVLVDKVRDGGLKRRGRRPKQLLHHLPAPRPPQLSDAAAHLLRRLITLPRADPRPAPVPPIRARTGGSVSWGGFGLELRPPHRRALTHLTGSMRRPGFRGLDLGPVMPPRRLPSRGGI